jgi:hypothetical protein
MNNGRRLPIPVGAVFVTACLAFAIPPPGPITLKINYPANQTFTYNLQVTSQIVISARGQAENLILTNASTVQMRTGVPSAGGINLDLRFSRYQTQVVGSGAIATELKRTSAATDAAAVKDARLLVHLQPDGAAQILSRPADSNLDQEVSMLEQFARADVFPAQAVAVGAHWTRQRAEPVPNLHTSVPLTLDCFLASVNSGAADASALIDISTHGSVTFTGDTPGSFDLNSKTENRYRLSTGLLEHSSGHTNNVVNVEGASPSKTTIDSHGTVQLLSSGK